ncbi:MAG: RNA polymerase sigma factor [Lachnospiraceae bacterium]|nr:RNA polymerase sigma factor [Lachnospiraceae bacterium]
MQVINKRQKINIDEELFERIQQGDKDAFQDLYEISYRSVYAFLLSLTQNSEDAHDLMQDTYVQIYKNSHMYKKQGNPMGWIIKIAQNLFYMKCRKDNARQFVNYEDIENEIGVSQIEDVDSRMLIEYMFSELSREDRMIVVMHNVNGFKFQEIANVLDKPLGTVLARYNRSIRKLQTTFKEMRR